MYWVTFVTHLRIHEDLPQITFVQLYFDKGKKYSFL